MATMDWSRELVQYEWVRLPLAARHASRSLMLKLVDGHYLTTWPAVASVLPPLACLLGLLIGWQHWGFEVVFSESMLVMMMATVLGLMSGHLGLLFVVGFALGDFFLSDAPWSPFVEVRVPLLIEYGLLSLLATTIPVLTKTLLVQLTPPDALSRRVRFVLAFVGHVALTCSMVYLWTQLVPILIRPVFTWRGGVPTVAAMTLLQHGAWQLVVVAGLASSARMVLQGLTAFRKDYGARLDALEEQLTAAEPVKAVIDRLPLVATLAGRTIWAMLLMAGMLQFWLDAILLAGLVFVLHAARERLFPVPLGPWPRLVEKVPALFRFIVGFVIVYFVSQAVLAKQFSAGTDTFRPIVLLVGMSMLIFFLMAPGLPKEQPVPEEEATT